jgi:hypothetical protein
LIARVAIAIAVSAIVSAVARASNDVHLLAEHVLTAMLIVCTVGDQRSL